jgi:hypothetical protein
MVRPRRPAPSPYDVGFPLHALLPPLLPELLIWLLAPEAVDDPTRATVGALALHVVAPLGVVVLCVRPSTTPGLEPSSCGQVRPRVLPPLSADYTPLRCPSTIGPASPSARGDPRLAHLVPVGWHRGSIVSDSFNTMALAPSLHAGLGGLRSLLPHHS